MDKNDDAKPTPNAPTDASARSAALRARIFAALRQGDRRGAWRDALVLLDRADAARELADQQLSLGHALLSLGHALLEAAAR